ncbi:hypothetical protein HMPREF1544_00865 [Mucor circinelloides 1006PhL]|uniref:DSC E3 ubiquitin ligase complex subunit 3 ubiquitin-like domain-containing protein n=1 Tax=Mucor circinelloides f. circinelloides (strain 1006PhL) TaxID=1220926 RepID=S2JPN5_MUCC1|nr:hypothetical protein HMPREF1544_00865 [Mucor circinelloides 1006PhL]
MGCCSSIPSNDEGETRLNSTSGAATTVAANNNHRQIQTQTQTQQQQQQHQSSPIQMNKPEVTITRASSSLHSQSNIEKSSLKEIDNNSSVTSSNAAAAAAAATTTAITTWPIYVRLSNNGQDITFQVPTQPPYLTVSGLRQELLPRLEKNARVKLIYLGRILPDQHVIVPTQTDADAPLPPPKNRAIQIQKEGVIQAMVTKS